MSHREDFLGCSRSSDLGFAPNVKAALIGSEARYAPDRALDTLHVSLDLAVDFQRQTISGSACTTLKAFRNGVSQAEFDAVGLEVRSVAIQGRATRFKHRDGKLTVFLKRAAAEGESVDILVRYRVRRPQAGLFFVSTSDVGGPSDQVWSQSQPEDARYWFPCHDNPHEKATSEVKISVPTGFRVISNGVLEGVARKALRSVYHWKMDQPHSIYLISIAAGRFSEIEERWKDVRVLYYCPKGREAHARRGFGKTVKALEYFSKATGVPYPYAKYAQVAAAHFPGGMENTTCTTQTDAILIPPEASIDNDMDYLVAHELAHQWFGDLVTCRDWSHAWLNEGFATYFEILFTAHDKGADEAADELDQNAQAYFQEEAHRYRRPIVCPNFKYPWVLFDRHTYEKGAWVLHMLRRELGEQLWWKAVKHYLIKHRHQSVETSDLIAAIGEATGKNLRPFFDRWVFKAGHPNFKIQYRWDAKRREAVLRVRQAQEISAESPIFKLNVEILFTGRGWIKRFTRKIEQKDEHFAFPLPAEPLNVEFDPEHGILKKENFMKPLSMWRHQLFHAPAALSRAQASHKISHWADNETIRLLIKAVRREKYWGARREMIRALSFIKTDAAYRAIKEFTALKHPKLRRAAVEALAGFHRAESARLLRKLALNDPSLHVAAQASRGLGRLNEVSHRGLLVSRLKTKSYRDILSSGAIQGLAESREPSVLPILRRASLKPFSYYARAQALRSLADFSPLSGKVMGWLCEAVSDPDKRLRLTAITLLGQLEDDRALSALRIAKKSACSRTQTYATEAIARIGDTNEKKS